MREAIAYTISFDGEPIVEVIQDPDAFDRPHCSVYFDLICIDCGSESFRHNQCVGCGAVAPWAAKLGCGLA